ncbi:MULTISPECIES: outer membrane protein assembly factor BamA [unclassified Paracoccus (in: a-proteobacteria)]|uniref:outer membrane protein assembly factor BamA n=1 Tax=unclassified Paracoccus (in: a-proteobacteria) TaxID=2688777 RepID=UPI0012B375FE|nr:MULTISPECIES: outer membrane protein assembly factor BamA [unclassified Paracoccus (in: a-proteobacteria)]UXU74637.1 outer membrane protein assembly factor BamA [Paracoccus sp. SMMA_5]UXU80531.1 outer membrane protein assembly factor BamA [Paracoccus sp. SMMA_5_TC]
MTDRKLGKGALALISALAVAAPVAMVASPASAYVFSNVRIEGNQRIEPQTILAYLDLPRGQDVSAGALNDALQRLQNSGLFESVELVPSGGTLVVRVSEYPTINVISFEGNRRLKDENLSKIIKSQARRVYSPAQAEADAAEISKAYAAEGRLAARVDPRIIRRSDNRVDLVFEIREGAVTEIERIGFVGNRAFSDARLRNVLQTKQAGLLRTFIKRDTFAPDRIAVDEKLLTDFYRSRGYADFKVQGIAPEVARERDAFYITFQIQEGPRYRFGNVTTVSEIPGVDAAEFQAQNRVRRGDVYNPAAIDITIRRMEALALRKGLNFVNIEPRITRNERNQILDLTFALTRGQRVFVERIDIEGNTTTLDEVIRRQFTTVEGDPFNPREIRNSAERLRALGYFSDVQAESRQGSSPEQVIVDVNVEEQPTGSLSFGVSYGVATGVGFNASLSEKNFLGRGQQVDLSLATGSGTKSSGLTFIEPYFLGRDLRARFQTWYNTTDRLNSEYNTRTVGLLTGLEFPVSENGRLELRYKLSKDTLNGVRPIEYDEETGELVGSSPILVRDQGGYFTSALGYTYSWDSRISGLDPLTGYRLRFSQDYAGLGGDIKAVTSALYAGVESRAWRESVTMLAEFEAGAVYMLDDQNSRFMNRYTGNNKIRGFEPNGLGPRDLNAPNRDALGGNYFWALRTELQFPLGLPEEYGITGGLFADAGSVWGLDDTLGAGGFTVDDSMHVRASVGASLFWTTPIGPLRFNFAKAIKKEDYDKEQAFDLTISTKF